MGGRYDAPELVHAWTGHDEWPAIHRPMISWTMECVGPADGMVLDLCSSTGLLGRRLTTYGYRCCAVTMPGPGLELGQAAGIYDSIPVLGLKIGPSELPILSGWLHEHAVRTVVARRAFPELWSALGSIDFAIMAGLFVDAGVRHIVLEGRVTTGRSVHPLSTAAQEAAALQPYWRPVEARGPFVHLQPA